MTPVLEGAISGKQGLLISGHWFGMLLVAFVYLLLDIGSFLLDSCHRSTEKLATDGFSRLPGCSRGILDRGTYDARQVVPSTGFAHPVLCRRDIRLNRKEGEQVSYAPGPADPVDTTLHSVQRLNTTVVLKQGVKRRRTTARKPHRKSIIKETLERLERKMAIGESRQAAKQAARAAHELRGVFAPFSTGKIHSYKTRSTYQEHILRFVSWARDTHHLTNLQALDARADECATQFLQKELHAHKSPYTLQVERSALRLFFDDRTLASAIILPRRTREGITRARTIAARDRRFQAAHWQPLYDFVRATGLRRSELTRLRVADIVRHHQGQLVIHVQCGKGGKQREVPVLPGFEPQILALVAGRPADERVFPQVPGRRLHDLRREYARALYRFYASLASPSHHAELPPAIGRLKRADYDLAAVQQVSWALGHNRMDVVFKHYLR